MQYISRTYTNNSTSWISNTTHEYKVHLMNMYYNIHLTSWDSVENEFALARPDADFPFNIHQISLVVIKWGWPGRYGRAVRMTGSGWKFRNGGVVSGNGPFWLGQLWRWLAGGIVARRINSPGGNSRHGTVTTHVRLLLSTEQIAKSRAEGMRSWLSQSAFRKLRLIWEVK